MKTYKLNPSGTFAQVLENGVATGEWANTENNEAYLKWLEEGNTPEPADEPADV